MIQLALAQRHFQLVVRVPVGKVDARSCAHDIRQQRQPTYRHTSDADIDVIHASQTLGLEQWQLKAMEAVGTKPDACNLVMPRRG